MDDYVSMRLDEVKDLVNGTADPAYALDGDGLIVAWNPASVTFFGVAESDALGRSCSSVLKGVDECGRECSEDCTVQQHARNCVPVKSYDVQVNAEGSRHWCNMTILAAGGRGSRSQYTIHVARPADLQKRFENLIRDFVASETDLPAASIERLMQAKHSPTKLTELTPREIEVLRLVADGNTTKRIAERLFISPTTVNNHVAHILNKMSARTRLEAVRRAEKAGLI